MNYDFSKKIHKEYFKNTGIRRIVPSHDYYWSNRLKATDARTTILDLLKSSKSSSIIISI